MVIENCMLCPRNCGATRTRTQGNGFCGMGADPVIARAALHFWEEPCISGKNGSGTVFFTGCNLKCVFCQNYQISTKKETGKAVTVQELADIFDRLAEKGANNINLVSPTHFVTAIIEALKLRKSKIPVVYNSGGYEKVETLKILDGLIDIYLPDFKYADNVIAQKYSGTPDYFEYAKASVLEMARQTGPAQFNDDGIMTSGTMVRHLILPSNTRNSAAVIEWLGNNLPKGTLLSLMTQYIPCGRAADFPEINRRITKREYNKVQELLFDYNLDGFVQERESASQSYIPSFNLEGVCFKNSLDK